jgi:flagellar motility protein MotE (MotC chaperone)
MSVVTDILDRLTGIAVVKERLADLSTQLTDVRKTIIEQQKDIAGLQGQLRAMIQMQAQAGKK